MRKSFLKRTCDKINYGNCYGSLDITKHIILHIKCINFNKSFLTKPLCKQNKTLRKEFCLTIHILLGSLASHMEVPSIVFQLHS